MRIDAGIRTLEANTRRQVADAETREAALIAEAQGEMQAAIAEAQAQLKVEAARIERTRQQLEADIVAPAAARMQAAINDARGRAARIVEDGRATAEVLEMITRAWKQAGPNARDIFLMQKLQSLVETLTATVDGVKVDKVTVLGTGAQNGQGNLAGKVIGASEQIKAALGVDVLGALQGRMAAPTPQASAASAPTASAPTSAPAPRQPTPTPRGYQAQPSVTIGTVAPAPTSRRAKPQRPQARQ